MSTATAYSAIKAFLDTNFTDVPLVYENTDHTLPDTPSAFVYVEISGNSYVQQSAGSGMSGNLFREIGLLWFHIMIPSGAGSLAARGYAETLITLLREAELASGRLEFMDASVGLGSAGVEDGNYWQLSASIEWKLDS